MSAVAKFATLRGDGFESYGDEVVLFASDVLGITLMPWQQQVLGVALEVEVSGRLHRHDVVVTVSRQQGKSVLVAVVAAWWAMRWPDQNIMFLAQTRAAAASRLEGVARSLTGAGVEGVKWFRGIGNERVEFENGSRIRVESPNIHGSHGESFDLVLLDEAFAYQEYVLQGVLPTQAAKPNSQLWMISTQGDEDSVVFSRYCERGREGAVGLAYFEWSAGVDDDVFNPDHFHRWMPAVPLTVLPANILPGLLAMAPTEALRAYGNLQTRSDASVFAVELVDRAMSGKLPAPVGVSVVAVDASKGSGGVSVAVGWVTDGVVFADLAEYRRGGPSGWVAARVSEIVRRHRADVVVMSFGPAITLKPELVAVCDELGVELWDQNVSLTAGAAMKLFEVLKEGEVRLGDAEPLRDAFLAARVKTQSDRWRFDRDVAVDQSPLVAVSLAVDVALQLSLQPAGVPEIWSLG